MTTRLMGTRVYTAARESPRALRGTGHLISITGTKPNENAALLLSGPIFCQRVNGLRPFVLIAIKLRAPRPFFAWSRPWVTCVVRAGHTRASTPHPRPHTWTHSTRVKGAQVHMHARQFRPP